MVKLGEICEIITDGTHQTPQYVDKGYIFLSSKNVTSKFIDWEDVKYISENLHNELYKHVKPQKGDILLAKNGTTGVAALVDRNAVFDIYVSLALLRPKQEIHAPYLLDVINSPYTKRQFNTSLKGIGVPNLHLKEIRNAIVPLPPIDVQKHIADILDKTQEIINLNKKQFEELDNLIKATFYDMFGDPGYNEMGWEFKRLAEVSKESLSYGSGASAIEYDENIRYIRITDINENGYLNNDIVSPSEINKKYFLEEGDILFARSGATVGKTLRYKNSYGQSIYAGYLIKLVPNVDIVLPDFIYYFTKTNYYKRLIESNIKAVAQPNINAKQYGDFLLPLPPIDLQNKFAQIVTNIEEQKAIVKQSLAQSQNLFNSLMSKYFD